MRGLIVFIVICTAWSQVLTQHSLEGVIKNEKGEKLSFATVFLLETNLATATDDKGYYKINNIPSGDYECKISFIGYTPLIHKVSIHENVALNVTLSGEIYNLDQIEIQANRTAESGPFTKINLGKTYLAKENLGQDVPFLLQWTPSVVVTSDAGTGIGYTSMRMRGSDQTRINVTINGVPLNDAESHNVFWVDLPDLMGTVKNIQIQRGVGTSSNGTGAFGGTVSISTHDHRVNPYLDISAGLGSFHTKKLQVSAGTGLLNGKYFAEGRLSYINSAGYIERASADLSSLYFSAGKVTNKSSLRLNVMSGTEVTYQAWYGTPEAKLFGTDESLANHYFTNVGSIYKTTEDSLNLFDADRRYNYYTYPDQVDNYRQTHYQLIWSMALSNALKLKSTLFYTKGKGFFEEFRPQDKFENYGLKPVLVDSKEISKSDIVRRRWLDNDFYGLNADVEYFYSTKWTLSSGINISNYDGLHFGNVVHTSIPHPDHQKAYHYYDNQGHKADITSYFKLVFSPDLKFQIHADVQWRNINYSISGIDNDLRKIDAKYNDIFINPKLGLSYQLNPKSMLYTSYAYGQREPSRSDFIDQIFLVLPKPEKLHNIESGFRSKSSKLEMEHNIYYMKYKDQLVLTGEINDVGAPIRINVPDSYRLGWESSITYALSQRMAIHTNFTISRNKIRSFEEVIPDYTVDFERKTILHEDTDISFSPSFTGAFQILYKPGWDLEAEFSSKFVSAQYLDNTSNQGRHIPAYHFQNVRIAKEFHSKFWNRCTATIMINNILNNQFVSNGYTYSYIYEKPITENFYYPQAGVHFLSGIQLGF
ncbi:MAG: TonB-dependent receptor [Saprospiraceae bacterium]|jgi:iron complex outermembrane receptor protein|nr:TonB-dependent receptor [Saprospiraceae bacterium]MBK9567037.1 TonB-dependent receptor [Saprospiraceae bacterium]MBP6446656.1 TonB-dependent receptor [Saprospiraceae bacterium]